jgi:hypothetical protein
MTPSLYSTRANFRLARAFALVALLCAVGLPVLEAGHLHSAGDGSAECLLCKSTPLLATLSAVAVLAVAVSGAKLAEGSRPASASTGFHPRQTRGPPPHS